MLCRQQLTLFWLSADRTVAKQHISALLDQLIASGILPLWLGSVKFGGLGVLRLAVGCRV